MSAVGVEKSVEVKGRGNVVGFPSFAMWHAAFPVVEGGVGVGRGVETRLPFPQKSAVHDIKK